jgi:hypothetical protein
VTNLPWRVRVTGSTSGTLAAIAVQAEMVDTAVCGCEKPWAQWRGDDLPGGDMDRLGVGQQWTDRTGNGRHLTGWPADPLRQPAKVVASLNGQSGADYRNVGTISAPTEGVHTLASPYLFDQGFTLVQLMHDVTVGQNWEVTSIQMRGVSGSGSAYAYLEQNTVDEQIVVEPFAEITAPSIHLWSYHAPATRTLLLIHQYLPGFGMRTTVNGAPVWQNDSGLLAPTIDKVDVGGSGRCVVLDTIVLEGDGSGEWDFGDGLCETLDAYLARRYGTIDPGPVVGGDDPNPDPETPVLVQWSEPTESQLTFTWRQVWQADLYEIEITPDGYVTQVIEWPPSNGNILADTGLSSGETRTYRVRARSGGVWGDWSAPLTMTTL